MNESVNHYGAVRIRVLNGVGNLYLTLYSMDKLQNQILAPINMSASSATEPYRLSNFNQQRIILRLETKDIEASGEITRILVYYKPLWASTVQ